MQLWFFQTFFVSIQILIKFEQSNLLEKRNEKDEVYLFEGDRICLMLFNAPYYSNYHK